MASSLEEYVRRTRNLTHRKGIKIKSVNNPPVKNEGSDGDIQIHNGHLYIKDRNTWHHYVPSSEFPIKKIGRGADEGNGNPPQSELKYTTTGASNLSKDLNTLRVTINKIIELLKLDIKG